MLVELSMVKQRYDAVREVLLRDNDEPLRWRAVRQGPGWRHPLSTTGLEPHQCRHPRRYG
jgi:hypothetical protein